MTDEPREGDPFLAGPTFAAPYHLSGDPAGKPYVYGRYGNPTWTGYERALGELEGGDALVFGSGMAAIATLLLALAKPGDRVALPADAYYNTRVLGRDYLPFEIVESPTDTEAAIAAAADAALVLVETPSNPGLDVVDIAALRRRTDAVVVVDNTLATPLGQRPLELGADYVVGSASKALAGHGDLILGYAAGRDMEPVLAARGTLGTVAGPFEVWLAHRSLATLDVRLERACSNALRLARIAAERVPVRYPGLPEDPAHAVAATQMRRFGPVIGFTLPSEAAADAFFAASDLVIEATSFGGVHTSAERRARWRSDDVPEGWIRLSAGCEDPDELARDFERALARALDAT